MHEIKFRGKRKDNGEWVQGYVHKLNNGIDKGTTFIIPERASALYSAEVDPETVGQYIGIKDGNKHEIYTGDIISQECECDTEYGCYHAPTHDIVIWDQEKAGFDFEALKKGVYSGEMLEDYADEWTIIGNRWDNPELLAPKEGADKHEPV
ncbi:YopX family protein [Paenibacillus sp. FSL R5-0749]|uniref:YopX family protein n=1 Tax=Paenibacillus sp. FSL R5-0749 TaxID=2921657 RepID=UPI00315A4B78